MQHLYHVFQLRLGENLVKWKRNNIVDVLLKMYKEKVEKKKNVDDICLKNIDIVPHMWQTKVLLMPKDIPQIMWYYLNAISQDSYSMLFIEKCINLKMYCYEELYEQMFKVELIVVLIDK